MMKSMSALSGLRAGRRGYKRGGVKKADVEGAGVSGRGGGDDEVYVGTVRAEGRGEGRERKGERGGIKVSGLEGVQRGEGRNGQVCKM